jgi:ankyrin repeat protein
MPTESTKNTDLNSKLSLAISMNNTKLAESLLNSGASINILLNETSPLLQSVDAQRYDIVKFLLEREDLDINIKDNAGLSPLYLASLNQNTDILKLLLQKYKLDINAQTKDGLTALNVAARNSYLEGVELILGYKNTKVDVNIPDNDGVTPLHLAAETEEDQIAYQMAQLLLEAGANPNVKAKIINDDLDCTNLTPLHLAAIFGRTGLIELLVEHGADVDIKTGEGLTAGDLFKAAYPKKINNFDQAVNNGLAKQLKAQKTKESQSEEKTSSPPAAQVDIKSVSYLSESKGTAITTSNNS